MANTDQKIEEIMKRVLAKMETGNEMKNTNGGKNIVQSELLVLVLVPDLILWLLMKQ